MNEFKFYGEENTENDDAVQLQEQQAEKEAEKEKNTKNTLFWTTRLYFCLSC